MTAELMVCAQSLVAAEGDTVKYLPSRQNLRLLGEGFPGRSDGCGVVRHCLGRFSARMVSRTPERLVQLRECLPMLCSQPIEIRPLGIAIDAKPGGYRVLTAVHQMAEVLLERWPDNKRNYAWEAAGT